MNVNHNNLYLAIGSFLGSLLSGCVAWITTYNIMWLVSIIAGVVSIVAGLTTIKEKRMSMRYMNDHFKNKTGGHE